MLSVENHKTYKSGLSLQLVTTAKFLICLIITKQNCLDTLNYTVIFISLWRAVKVPHQVSWVTIQRMELQLNVQGRVSDVYKDYQRSNLPHMIFVQASPLLEL